MEPIELPLLGMHHISNALAAFAAADFFGVPRDRTAEGLKHVMLTPMRMERIRTCTGYHIINDAWNASPASVKAAIRSLAELSGFRRKLLVLGDMLELGEREEEYHLEIGQIIPHEKIDYVFTLGPLGKFIARGAESAFPPGRVCAFEHKQQLVEALRRTAVKSEDMILIKGSRGMQMEEIIELLDS
jgi:UDP-N-acetylmuramoyl-tripeptide--D-alanyl-D-alanine ligase